MGEAPEGGVGGSAKQATLEAWVLATLPRAVAFARSLLRDHSAADDVVQDCYCRLIAKADVYDIPRDGTKILFRAITNASIDRTARDRRHQSLDPDSECDGVPEPADVRMPTPADDATRRELEAALDAGLAQLPPAQRAAVELKALGHSLQEIADAIGVTATNAGVLVHRGRAALAKHLTRFQDGAP